MPKYRQLHTKIIDSYDFAEMPDDFIRVAWLLLPLILDAEGRGIYDLAWIRSRMFPLRQDVELEQIAQAMEWLEGRGMVISYTSDGRHYFYVPTWKLYQSGTEREAKSVIPAPEKESREEEGEKNTTPELVASKSRLTQELPGSPVLYCIESESDIAIKSVRERTRAPAHETGNAITQFHTDSRASERLYQEVTGQISIPADRAEQALEMLADILDCYSGDGDRAAVAGKPIFAAWCNTVGKTGKKYSPTNPGWLSKWLEQLAPRPQVDEVASIAERIRRGAEKASRR